MLFFPKCSDNSLKIYGYKEPERDAEVNQNWLHYVGLTKHNPKHIGLSDTKVTVIEFFEL